MWRKDMWTQGKGRVGWITQLSQKKEQNWAISSESVIQSCPILCDPMACSPPGSSVHGILQAIFPTQGLNPGLSFIAGGLFTK